MPPVTVAVDAMGADRGPRSLILGARAAVDADPDLTCIVVATAAALGDHAALLRHPRLATEIATGVIGMAEPPVAAVHDKRGASLVRAVRLARRDNADAVLTAGNSGAAVVAGGAFLRRLPGVNHPVLAAPLGLHTAAPKILVDCGATTRRDPAWLVEHAHLGVALAGHLPGPGDPPVGLLANGVEPTKGDDVIAEADRRLRASGLHYVGLVEPLALYEPVPRVVVTDGLTGNLVLKTLEATLDAVRRLAGQAAGLDGPTRHEGGILLGVGGLVVKAHGTATPAAVSGGVALAARLVRAGLGGGIGPAAAVPGRRRAVV
jgi:glycerol-3-phosphate acyltransferase PlsX